MQPVWIVLIVVVVVLLWIAVMYNVLVRGRNTCVESWSDIDTELKRRYDLIPNLVEVVKGYAKHERELFEKVTQARANAINAGTVKDQGQAENVLSGTLKSLFAVAENYPDLKANQNFLLLQEELAGTEGKIAFARQFYNDSVMKYNTKQQVFPASIIARMGNFKERDYFEIGEAEAKGPVKVSF